MLNKNMEKTMKTKETKTPKDPENKSGHGGARKGAGRPKGSRDQVSIKALLDTLDAKTGGRDYEELLIEDFLESRTNKDTQTTLKYHTLILNKVMNSLARVEVTDSKDLIEQKQAAFAEALAKLTAIKTD
jgi:hypothetical protein